MHNRQGFYLFLIICLLAGGGLYFATHFLRESTRHSFQYDRLDSITNALQMRHLSTVMAVRAIAKNAGISSALMSPPSPELVATTSQMLDTMLLSIGGELAFLLNKDGVVVLSSYYARMSIIGNNYAYRPYFQHGMLGEEDLYPALGGKTATRGVYYSAPVRSPLTNEVIGVMAVKRPIDDWTAVLKGAGMPACIVSPDGVIFDASEPSWILRTRADVPASLRKRIIESRQFGDKGLEALEWFRPGPDISIDHRLHHVAKKPIFLPDWWLVTMFPANRMVALPSAVYMALIGVAVVLLLLSVLSMGLFRNVERKRNLEKELRNVNTSLESTILAKTSELLERNAELNKLSVALAQSPSIIIITDLGGNIEYVNPVFLATTGYSREEVIGQNPRILKSGEMSDAEYARLWRTITSGDVWRGEFHNKRKDGTLYWEYAVIGPIRDEQGTIVNYLGVKEDITNRKAAEEQVRWLARFPSENPSPVIRVSFDGDLLYINSAASAISGVLLDDSGKHLTDDWLAFTGMVASSGMPVRKEIHAGEQVFASTFSPVIEDRYVNIYALDVTEQIQTSRALRKSNDALIELNRELQLNHKKLIQSEKLASLGQLAAGVAHEINNPVGFVMSNLGTMAEYIMTFEQIVKQSNAIQQAALNNSPKELKAALDGLAKVYKDENIDFVMEDAALLVHESREGIERVRDIVLNLKSFGRVDDMGVKEFQINDALESSLKMVWNELKYRCEVVREFGELPRYRGLEGQLKQVFVNLLVNASHAIESKGTVTIRTACKDQVIRIEVADTGCGIPQEHLAMLFDPFFTTKPVGKGTGLGLSIVHGIIARHNGEIHVTSEVGQGTTFAITLPAEGITDDDLRAEFVNSEMQV